MKNIEVEKDVNMSMLIEGKYDFKVIVDIELTPGRDFYLKIMFGVQSIGNVQVLTKLFNKRSALDVYSDFFVNNDYDITQIVVTDIYIDNNNNVTWEALSDKPFELEIK